MQTNVEQIPATPGKKGQDTKATKPRWTSESLLALAEETSNHGAHIHFLIATFKIDLLLHT
jgi:hypothetical protein